MIKAVLLDLDDTLLVSPKDAFLSTLFTSLTGFLRQELGVEDVRELLVTATRRMISNLDPTLSNAAIWRQAFETLPHHTAAEFDALLGRFYSDHYLDLRQLTSPDPAAAELIGWLLGQGYHVVVATNPLYPRIAIEQRIRWAGFDPEKTGFSWITHSENSHFVKPQPHYYEEIMARVGLEPYEAIMVGDNWNNDIVPAALTGMRTFWVNDKSPAGATPLDPDGQGTLADFARCVIVDGWLDTLTPNKLQAAHMIPRLLGNVAALMGMTEDIPAHFWMQHPLPEEWSPLEVIAHLEDSERTVQRPRLEIIAREDNPFLSAPKTPQRPGEFNLSTHDGGEMGRKFAAERMITIDFLNKLPEEAWKRPARHSIYGPTNLLEMAAFTTRHDQLHIKQLCQTLGKCE